MEQFIRKERLILAAGGLLTLSLAAAHFFSPVSKRLSAGEDVELVLLDSGRPMLFIYHPFSRTVNAVRVPARAARGASAYARAAEVLKLFSKEGEPAYLSVQAPDPAAFEDFLNTWRARPARLPRFWRGLRELRRSGDTNLSGYDLAVLAAELSGLTSANFIKEEFAKTRPVPQAVPEAAVAEEAGAAPAAARLEVLNASGKKDLAGAVTRYLRRKGFDVINFGTYGSVEGRTKIVYCSGDIEGARRVRDVLGLGGLEIYSKPEKLGIVQIRVILGSDFVVKEN